MSASFSITSTRIDAERMKSLLQDGACGACVTFEGWVRDHHEGRDVLRLEYEAYEAVAKKEGAKILDEAMARFGVDRIVCEHRVGPLEIGEIAVWVGVGSGHRGEAFAACRYVIDEVKHRVPIWKKEFYTTGDSGWVNCEGCAAAPHQG